MRSIFKVITFIILSNSFVYSQKTDSDSLINTIKTDVTNFFIDQGYLDEDKVQNSLDYVSIIDLKDNTVIGFKDIGIYAIGVFQSHSEKHILIKENYDYKIYNLKNLGNVLNDIVEFSRKNNISEKTMLYYIKNVLQKFEDNYTYQQVLIKERD